MTDMYYIGACLLSDNTRGGCVRLHMFVLLGKSEGISFNLICLHYIRILYFIINKLQKC